MRDGGNMINLGEGVTREASSAIQNLYPIGVDFEVVVFQPADVDRKVREFMASLGQAVAIVPGRDAAVSRSAHRSGGGEPRANGDDRPRCW